METNKKYYIGNDNLYQGRLYVYIDTNGQLLIESDASWELWKDPVHAIEDVNRVNSFSKEYLHTISQSQKIRPATWKEIVAAGWDKYVINKPK